MLTGNERAMNKTAGTTKVYIYVKGKQNISIYLRQRLDFKWLGTYDFLYYYLIHRL